MTTRIHLPEKVGDADRSEAKRLMEGIDRAAQELREYIAPTMGTRYIPDPGVPEDELGVCLVCPWCGDDLPSEQGVIAVDMATRWTYSDELDDNEISFTYDSDSDFEGVAYISTCCELPVSEPEGWGMDN